VGRHGIRVNLLAPGLLDTGMAQALPQHRQDEFVARSALRRLGSADEVARAAAFLCSDGARFVTGAKVTLDGGL
jgi:3-oxoacyl-[acyl-carrier protein] reductase